MKLQLIKKSPVLLLLSFTACSLFEPDTGISETFTFISSSLTEISKVVVYYPESYTTTTPVIYLLNGWGADAYAWGSGIDLANEAHQRNIMFVSLSAGSNHYVNDPKTNENYEDYVLEVVAKTEQKYEIEIDYKQRALCGISNGGGGALYLLSEHPDSFIACGSLSGTSYSNISNFSNFTDRGIRIDVGTGDDTVLSQLRWLHNRLTENKVEHEYYEHPGEHDWVFWAKYCPKQFDFLEELVSG